MSRYPHIDRPCPLGVDEQRRLAGWCAHCTTEVHALDELDDSERRRFMAARTGLVCVSYRLPKARAAMFGATMAAGMIAGAVMAGQERTAPPETGAVPEDEMIIIVVGGVSKAEHASWVDDSGLPDLPVIVETAEPDAVLPLKDPAPRR